MKYTPCEEETEQRQRSTFNENRNFDQDVIKSYSSYICHTTARKITRLKEYPLYYRLLHPPSDPPYPSANFPSPPFFGFLVRSIPLPLFKKGSSNFGSPSILMENCNHRISPFISILYMTQSVRLGFLKSLFLS